MGKVTVIVAPDKSETVETDYISTSTHTSHIPYEKRVCFQVRSNWPACLRADPQRAVSDEWEMVVSCCDSLYSGRIFKINGSTVYIDTRF